MANNLFGGGFGSPYGISWGEVSRQGFSNTILVVDNTSHSHTVDNITLTQVHVLTVNDSSHVTSSDVITLTQIHTLAIANTSHTLTSDVIALIENKTVSVQNASHALTSDVIALVQQHALQIANAAHTHSVENIVLLQQHLLTVASTSHGHTVDGNLAISQYFLLNQPHDSVIGVTSPEIFIAQNNVLTVDNSLHSLYDSLSDIIDWASVGKYYGIYIKDYGESGSVESDEADSGIIIKNTNKESGNLSVHSVDNGIFVKIQ